MSRVNYELTATFPVTDASGARYVVNEYTRIETVHTTGGLRRCEGVKNLTTTNGLDVNFVSEGRYEIVGVDGNIPVQSA